MTVPHDRLVGHSSGPQSGSAVLLRGGNAHVGGNFLEHLATASALTVPASRRWHAE